jgi:tetratricopeptide (TPR) repeat protein
MGIFFGWIIFSFLAGYLGMDRKIGFFGAFFLSLIFSPLIGFIFALSSERVQRQSSIPTNEPYKIIPENIKTVSEKQKELPPETAKLIREGQIKVNNKDYDGAIEKFENVLALLPNAPNTNYQLATIYSVKEDKDNAYKYLTRAIEQGFNDFAALNSTPMLNFLRSEPEFKDYVQNGYKLPTLANSGDDVISKLEKLGNLKEKGVITEEEFAVQKSKLLNS